MQSAIRIQVNNIGDIQVKKRELYFCPSETIITAWTHLRGHAGVNVFKGRFCTGMLPSALRRKIRGGDSVPLHCRPPHLLRPFRRPPGGFSRGVPFPAPAPRYEALGGRRTQNDFVSCPRHPPLPPALHPLWLSAQVFQTSTNFARNRQFCIFCRSASHQKYMF